MCALRRNPDRYLVGESILDREKRLEAEAEAEAFARQFLQEATTTTPTEVNPELKERDNLDTYWRTSEDFETQGAPEEDPFCPEL